jgi:NAD(P)-dependent dehydrogenase (short-subunit alcohol dehydrogenase family)
MYLVNILIKTWQLDLASFASTQAFAKKFNESGLPLDILVSNAGLGHGPWVETADGYEITYVFYSFFSILFYLKIFCFNVMIVYK